MLQIVRLFSPLEKGACIFETAWVTQTLMLSPSSCSRDIYTIPSQTEISCLLYNWKSVKELDNLWLLFFPTSNTITIWLLAIFPKTTAWVYCRHQNDFKILKKSARLPKRLHFEIDDSWEWKQNNNLHSNPSRKEFTAVSWLIATILKTCSADILGNSISSSEINAGALSWLVRKKG